MNYEDLPLLNAMTVDVEDYFQVSALENYIRRKDWDNIPCRVEGNIDNILNLFDNKGVKATFFVLGWIAERYPGMVRKIADEGHEIGSHGWEHIRVTHQAKDEFRRDVTRTKALLEDVCGQQIKGYRAASYSINQKNLWALGILAETGHQYSSSIVPIRHDLYGMRNAPRFAFQIANGNLLEVPITTVKLGKRNIPCGGGGWFRLYPYSFSRWAMRRVNKKERQPCVFYFHPWEIDPDQPRQTDIPLKTRFRHYTNLGHMQSRLEKLLEDFRWAPMNEVFLQDRSA